VDEDATTCAAPVPTATAVGMPEKISSGVRRKPPPTPSRPETKPIAAPIPMIRSTSTAISAMGR
jgi:hypothetical protein